MRNKENANNINLENSNLEHTSRLHNETLKAKHEDEDVEELNEEIAEKFFFINFLTLETYLVFEELSYF